MNIGLLQMTTKSSQPMHNVQEFSGHESSFDKIFNDAMHSSPNTSTLDAEPIQHENEQMIEDVMVMIETDSLEDALQVLQVEQDATGIFVILEGELVPVEELMTLEDVASLLNMTPESIQKIVEQLVGKQDEQLDVWTVLQRAPQLLEQITAVLQGDSQVVTPEEAVQLAKFIQLAQLVGQKTDTVYKQEVALHDAKQALQVFSQQLTVASEQQNPSDRKEQQKQTFTQTLSQTVQTSQTRESAEQIQPTVQQTTVQQNVKSVSVLLPNERSAQSEALVKEIQNHINRMQMSNNNGIIKLTMRLFPENLGQIRIEVMQQDGVLQARILATSAAGKELLDSSLNQLKTTLVAQNIQLDRIDIAQSLQSSDAGRDQGLFNQFFRQQQEDVEEQQEESDEEEIAFDELLEQQMQLEEV